MIDVGTHNSVDESPVPMFTEKVTKSKGKSDSDMGAVFTEMGYSVLQPKPASTPQPSPRDSTSGISLGKVPELRSKFLQQMRELRSLFETGALTQQFFDQKLPILDHLKKIYPLYKVGLNTRSVPTPAFGG